MRNLASAILCPLLIFSIQILVLHSRPCLGEREVLIRDRLVLVLCDQIDSYLRTGNFPPPIKKMPAKYRNVTAGKPNGVRMEGFKVVFPSGGKKQKRDAGHHPILDLMF